MLRLSLGLLLACAVQGQEFFPENVLGRTPEEHAPKATRYSKYLSAMGEPSLWRLSQQNPPIEMYRFTWLRSFDRPIAVRVVVDEKRKAVVLTKILSGKGGYEPGKLVVSRSKRLDATPAMAFAREPFDGLDVPTLTADDRITLDGAEWIVEWVKDGDYHVVVRTSPPQSDPVHAFGMWFANDLADLKLLYREVY